MKQSSTLRKIAGLTGLMVGAFALSVVAQSTWTPAPGTAPACPTGTPGCDAPLNSGGTLQSKTGELILRLFTFNAGGPGSVTQGHVLTALDTSGKVGWAAIPSASAVTRGFHTYSTPGNFTFTVPAGVTNIIAEIWGGGARGIAASGFAVGGTSGGYVKVFIPVTGGSTCSLTVGGANALSRVACGSVNAVASSGGNGGTVSVTGTTAYHGIAGTPGIQGDGNGGSAPNGGGGGVGENGLSDCSDGIAPGGGGGGRQTNTGCSGAAGAITISY